MKGNRGIVDPVTLVLIAGLAAGYVLGGWKPLAVFKKKPETAQLTQLQAKLDAQQAVAAQAAKEAEAAKIAERQKLETQIKAAQRDALGAEIAIIRVPKPGPEAILALQMINRTNLKLGIAVGKLPQEDQEAMLELIDQVLSGKQAQIDAANARLAALDADFKAVTAEREQLRAEIPKLTQRAVKAEETAKATQLAVTAKTEEVKTWANKTDAALRENGGLIESLRKGALWVGGIYLFFVLGIPAIVKHMQSSNPIKGLLRDANGYFLNPLTYHDAKQKLKAQIPPKP